MTKAAPMTAATICAISRVRRAPIVSQAMESVTRAFYTRSDLDLILTAPASARKVFSAR
jgi:ABC-2 type transport system permease protein